MKPLHRKALVHLDEPSGRITLLPPGMRYVEENDLLAF